jgi:hypothetical protein
MKVKFLKEYTAKITGGDAKTISAGTVLDLSPDKASRLIAAGVGLDLDAVISICRDFFDSANKVYQGTATPAEAWALYKEHLKTAEACFDQGRIAEAQGELNKALGALQLH